MDIVGTRGFKGKKAKTAHSQFNALFEVVDQDENNESEDDFDAEQQQRLEDLEHSV